MKQAARTHRAIVVVAVLIAWILLVAAWRIG